MKQILPIVTQRFASIPIYLAGDSAQAGASAPGIYAELTHGSARSCLPAEMASISFATTLATKLSEY